MGISVETANRGACDACGRIIWSIDFEPLPGVTVLMDVHEDFGGMEVQAYSCVSDPAHVADAVRNVLTQQGPDGPLAIEEQPPPPVMPRNSERPVPDLRKPREQNFDGLVAAVKSSRPPKRPDAQLREQVLSMWIEQGARPSLTQVKKRARVGDKRAKELLDSVEGTVVLPG